MQQYCFLMSLQARPIPLQPTYSQVMIVSARADWAKRVATNVKARVGSFILAGCVWDVAECGRFGLVVELTVRCFCEVEGEVRHWVRFKYSRLSYFSV